jgi:hypothetical protein
MAIVMKGGAASSGGITPGYELAVDRLRNALRVSPAPLDHSDPGGNLLGHYRTNLITGATVSIASNGALASMRWSGPLPPVAVILRISAMPEVTAAITAATPLDLECIFARSFSVSDTGGTATVPSRMRSSMNLSSMADMRVATTTALTAGTRTLDSVGFGYASWASLVAITRDPATPTNQTAVAIGAGEQTMKDLYKWDVQGSHPPVLGVNDGIVIRQSIAGPVTGAIRWTIVVEHCEVVGF